MDVNGVHAVEGLELGIWGVHTDGGSGDTRRSSPPIPRRQLDFISVTVHSPRPGILRRKKRKMRKEKRLIIVMDPTLSSTLNQHQHQHPSHGHGHMGLQQAATIQSHSHPHGHGVNVDDMFHQETGLDDADDEDDGDGAFSSSFSSSLLPSSFFLLPPSTFLLPASSGISGFVALPGGFGLLG
jgi:hypothetical protein